MEVDAFAGVSGLRVKDVDLHYLHITVRDAKGGRGRKTDLPVSLAAPLRGDLNKVKVRHTQDLADDAAACICRLHWRKFQTRRGEWAGSTYFPLTRPLNRSRTGIERRHHVNEKNLQKRREAAVCKSGVAQASELSHAAALICDALVENGYRYPNRAGTIRASPRE